MHKEDAISLFESRADLAEKVGITAQAVSGWPDPLPLRISDRVLGAAVRTGRLRVIDPPACIESVISGIEEPPGPGVAA